MIRQRTTLAFGYAAIFAMSAVVLASAAAAGEVRLCTGKTGDPYANVGDLIASYAKDGLTVSVVKDTGGTWGNINRAVLSPNPECDAWIGQPDGLARLARENAGEASKVARIGTLHREYLHVLCNVDADVGELEDLEGTDRTVLIGTDGSGGHLIWQNFVAEDDGYGSIITQFVGGDEAVVAVSNGEADCMLLPAGVPSNTARTALDEESGFGEKIELVQAQDKDFNDATDKEGNPYYEFTELDGGAYGRFWDVDTVSWLAGVYINKERVTGSDRTALAFAVNAASKQARKDYGQ